MVFSELFFCRSNWSESFYMTVQFDHLMLIIVVLPHLTRGRKLCSHILTLRWILIESNSAVGYLSQSQIQLSRNDGEYVYESWLISFLFWSISSLPFERGHWASAHLLVSNPGTQGFWIFMSSRWSCRSCPLQHQCDLCSINSPLVPRTSIPFKIEEYWAHHFMWRMKENVNLDVSLCAMVIDTNFKITLPSYPQAPPAQCIDWGMLGVLWVRLKSTKLQGCS